MNNLNSKDILGTRDLSIDEINLIFDTAKKFKEVLSRPIKKVPSLRHLTVANIFFENSTRTKLSFELAEHGITVNNVLPGFTDTNRLKTLIETKSKTLNKSVEEITKKMISSVPANRFGEAAEVADAIAFLCSPSASYINGINLPVDGGRTTSL